MTDPKKEPEEHSPWWKAPWEFLVETLVGSFIFIVIGAGAVGLNYLVHFLEAKEIDEFILFGLTAAEYLLFSVDLILFGRFIWRTACRTWRKL